MAVNTLPPRADIPVEETWNAESVYPTAADWESDLNSISGMIDTVSAYKGSLGNSASVLVDFLEARSNLLRKLWKVNVYAGLFVSADGTNQEYLAMRGKAQAAMGRVISAIAFAEPEMIAIGHDTLKAWMESSPKLAVYEHYFDNLFRREKHVRSAEIEELLGGFAEPYNSLRQIYDMLTDSDLQFAPAVDSEGSEHPVSQGTRMTHMHQADRELRRTSYNSFTQGHLDFQNTLAATLATFVKMSVANARAHRFPTAIEASLHANNIPLAVFDNLISTFRKNIPTWHKYWNVRRRILGVDTLQPYDIWAPLTKEDPVVPYNQAVDWIVEGMKPLGDEYVNVLRQGCLDDRWVDRATNVGKRQGAFSSGSYDTMPFIFMSYDNTMGAMSTLAHELGHSLHSYLSRQHQPYVYSGYSMFVAEVASNFDQALTRAYLFEAKKNDANFQIAIIEEAMQNFYRYFFIMPLLAQFEREIHTRAEQGKPLTAKDMNSITADLFAEGYGDEMDYDRDRIGITWATFLHMYLNFYVFQYSTGISAAHALADKVLKEGEPAAKKYVEFLSMGSSKYPIDALKHAGVDMTTPEAVETTFAVLADYVARLEKLTGV